MTEPRSPWPGFPAYDGEPGHPDPAAGPADGPVAREPRRWPLVVGAVATAIVVGVAAGAIGALIGASVGSGQAGTRSVVVNRPADSGSGGGSPRATDTIAGIVQRALPMVVSINVAAGVGEAGGSGFIVRPEGYIVTNNHVIESAVDGGDISVVFNDGSSEPATIVGRNVSYDLAVLKVDLSGLPVAVIGDSGALSVGDTTIAIGAPLGLDGTVTSGIVSSLDRAVIVGEVDETSYINAIQTDAAINPGNSGGPLLDGQGRVIGVNSAIATLATGGQAGSIGLGFAIPISSAKRITDEIIETGSATTPIIGVNVDTRYPGPGAMVLDVVPGGPGEEAGIEAGDLILEFDGRPVPNGPELIVAVRSRAPGDSATLLVERDGERREVSVVLGSSKGP